MGKTPYIHFNIDTELCMAHSHAGIEVYNAGQTAHLLDYPALVEAIAQAAAELERGEIISPERLVVPLGQGGVMLSMPATASDLAIHKLVNVQPHNGALGLPTIHGAVSLCDARTGAIRAVLDGPEVTGRRTAAVSMLAIGTLLPCTPRSVVLYGTGVQARHHVQALAALYPQAQVWVRSRSQQSAEAFCRACAPWHSNLAPCPNELPEAADVVILLTTSLEPVYDLPGQAGRLVIGVGAFKPEMAEIGPQTLASSQLFADEPDGARHEAGDLLRARVDWAQVNSLASALRGQVDLTRPVVFKSVGTGAWDLAAGRVAWGSMGL